MNAVLKQRNQFSRWVAHSQSDSSKSREASILLARRLNAYTAEDSGRRRRHTRRSTRAKTQRLNDSFLWFFRFNFVRGRYCAIHCTIYTMPHCGIVLTRRVYRSTVCSKLARPQMLSIHEHCAILKIIFSPWPCLKFLVCYSNGCAARPSCCVPASSSCLTINLFRSYAYMYYGIFLRSFSLSPADWRKLVGAETGEVMCLGSYLATCAEPASQIEHPYPSHTAVLDAPNRQLGINLARHS